MRESRVWCVSCDKSVQGAGGWGWLQIGRDGCAGARVRGSWSDPGVSLAPTTVKMPDEKRDLVYQHCFKILVGSFRTEHIHSWV